MQSCGTSQVKLQCKPSVCRLGQPVQHFLKLRRLLLWVLEGNVYDRTKVFDNKFIKSDLLRLTKTIRNKELNRIQQKDWCDEETKLELVYHTIRRPLLNIILIGIDKVATGWWKESTQHYIGLGREVISNRKLHLWPRSGDMWTHVNRLRWRDFVEAE